MVVLTGVVVETTPLVAVIEEMGLFTSANRAALAASFSASAGFVEVVVLLLLLDGLDILLPKLPVVGMPNLAALASRRAFSSGVIFDDLVDLTVTFVDLII